MEAAILKWFETFENDAINDGKLWFSVEARQVLVAGGHQVSKKEAPPKTKNNLISW